MRKLGPGETWTCPSQSCLLDDTQGRTEYGVDDRITLDLDISDSLFTSPNAWPFDISNCALATPYSVLSEGCTM